MAKWIGARLPGAGRGDARVIPRTGNLVWLSFTPQAGREQAGRRPALVLSPRSYNAKVGLCLGCPVTQQAKGYPFEIALPDGLAGEGRLLAASLQNAEWAARQSDIPYTHSAERVGQ